MPKKIIQQADFTGWRSDFTVAGDKAMNLQTAKLKRYPNYPPYGLGIISNQLEKEDTMFKF